MPQTKPDEYQPRSISRHQYGMLKFIHENKVTRAYLRHANGGTLGSVAYWHWIASTGPSDDDLVFLTKEGEVELEAYSRATFRERTTEGELTERCQRLLKYSRRVVPMVKSA